MQRRTFLKVVFAAAVAPASVVKALYRPEITVEWIRFRTNIQWDLQEILHEEIKKAFFCPGIIKTKPDCGYPKEFQERFLKEVGPDTPMLPWKNYTFEYQPPKRR